MKTQTRFTVERYFPKEGWRKRVVQGPHKKLSSAVRELEAEIKQVPAKYRVVKTVTTNGVVYFRQMKRARSIDRAL